MAACGPARTARGLSRKAILDEIDPSLQRLGTDYVDLYQIHRWDSDTPIEETLEALNDVVRAGKARYIGASSMYAWQFAKALAISERRGWARFVCMQNSVQSPLPRGRTRDAAAVRGRRHRRDPLEPAGARPPRPTLGQPPACASETDEFGKRLFTRMVEADRQVVDRVTQVAEARSLPRAQIALAWLLSKPVITAPIIGATKLQHLDDALAAVSVKLTAQETATLEEAYVPHPLAGFG